MNKWHKMKNIYKSLSSEEKQSIKNVTITFTPLDSSTGGSITIYPLGKDSLEYHCLFKYRNRKFYSPDVVSFGTFFKDLLVKYFNDNVDDFKRLYETIYAEYNPIHNYDGKEVVKVTIDAHSDTLSNTITSAEKTTTVNDDITMTNGQKHTTTTYGGVDTFENINNEETVTSVTGFNDIGSLQDSNSVSHDLGKNKSSKTGSDTITDDSYTDSNIRTIDTTQNGYQDSNVNVNEYGNQYEERETIKGGNLGVTMTQDMISKEIDIRLTYNLYWFLDRWIQENTIFI